MSVCIYFSSFQQFPLFYRSTVIIDEEEEIARFAVQEQEHQVCYHISNFSLQYLQFLSLEICWFPFFPVNFAFNLCFLQATNNWQQILFRLFCRFKSHFAFLQQYQSDFDSEDEEDATERLPCMCHFLSCFLLLLSTTQSCKCYQSKLNNLFFIAIT